MSIYKHFKGKEYEVLFEAEHSETTERMIIYKDEDGKIFARPASIFFDQVEIDGKTVPRFFKLNKN